MRNRKKTKLSKTGIPILDADDDFVEVFTGEKCSEAGFEEMIEKSFAEEGFKSLFKEKTETDKTRRRLSDIIKKYPPQDEIDLHGRTAWEAEEETRHYLQRASASGFRAVKIIVGKGLHSEGKPVVKEVVERIVVEFKRKKAVSTFIWEKESKIKSGAVIVYLV